MNTHYDIGLIQQIDYTKYGRIVNSYAVNKMLKILDFSVLNIVPPYIESNRALRFMNTFYGSCETAYTESFDNAKNYNQTCQMFVSSGEDSADNAVSKYDGFYKLDFAEYHKRKVAFAGMPSEKESNQLLTKYNAVSVTDKKSAAVLRKQFGVRAETLFDPILCIPKFHWKELSIKSTREVPKKYTLTYITQPDQSKRKAIQFYRGKLEMDCYHIVDGTGTAYADNKKTLNLKNTLPELLTESFIKYFVNADFVLTDNYDGVCLALVLNKPFIFLGEDDRTTDLLTSVGLQERVIFDTEHFPMNNRLLQPVNFEKTNQVIAEQSKKTFAWLKNALTAEMEYLPTVKAKNTDKAITSTLNLNLCVGCSACVNVCPKGALSLQPDKYGYYCTSIDHDLCINCGLCSKACPVLSPPKNDNLAVPECYSFIASDEQLVMNSSSGGVFSLLAEEVFQRGGVVVGGAWKDDFTVEHIIIDKPEDMYKLRKSKYLQSYLGDTYKQVKQYLDKGRFVLFSGCGCQTAGLRKYLKKEYDHLLIVDIFCHYSPSPMFFRKYTESSFDNLQKYEFRYKEGEQCWDCLTIKATDNHQEMVRRSGTQDEYQRVFHTEVMMSEHCANCQFQKRQRYGDISLGDFWNIQKHEETIPYKKGVSCVFINNDKGKRFFDSLPENAIKWKKEAPVEWVGFNGFIYKGKNKLNQKNFDFYKAIRFMPFEDAANYALKPNKGIANTINGSNPLQFDSQRLHFRFDDHIWEESFQDNTVYLKVKSEQTESGIYAVLPLEHILDKHKTYQLNAKFRFKSDSKVLYFYIKDSGSNRVHLLAAHRTPKNIGQNWIEIHQTFTPPSNIFDEFVFGASQLKGIGAFIAIDYIYITEIDE